MSKKTIRKESFKDFLRELEKSKIESSIQIETIEERKYFLIVAEGARTEPIYFNYIKSLLPKNFLDTIVVNGAGDNTVNVVEKSIIERDKRLHEKLRPPFDEVWAVFDKDDFPDARFNEAVRLAAANGIESGHTNQAFELWYVLHFQFLDTAIGRKAYFKILSKILGKSYKKNDISIVKMIFQEGNIRNAINYANNLESNHDGKTASASWPVTRVHHLVQRLLDYAKIEY